MHTTVKSLEIRNACTAQMMPSDDAVGMGWGGVIGQHWWILSARHLGVEACFSPVLCRDINGTPNVFLYVRTTEAQRTA